MNKNVGEGGGEESFGGADFLGLVQLILIFRNSKTSILLYVLYLSVLVVSRYIHLYSNMHMHMYINKTK